MIRFGEDYGATSDACCCDIGLVGFQSRVLRHMRWVDRVDRCEWSCFPMRRRNHLIT